MDMTPPADLVQELAEVNKKTLIGIQIETKKGIDKVDELVSHPDIDLVFTGIMDLAITLGVPPDPNHPEVCSALDRIFESTLKHGHIIGMQAMYPEYAGRMMKKGLQFVVCGSVRGLIIAGAKRMVDDLAVQERS